MKPLCWIYGALAAAAEPEGEQPNRFAQWLREWLAPPLRQIEAPLDDWLGSLPSWTGPACATALFLLTGLWISTLKRRYVYLGAPDQARWRDLRLWALLVLVPYIAVVFDVLENGDV